eukprot:14506104-Alexandrium_andersonii.AAC.1
MSASLVGSEMCIRDSSGTDFEAVSGPAQFQVGTPEASLAFSINEETVSYTHLTLPTICSV